MSARAQIEEQGIVTILDGEPITKVPPSLRRTISADLSSKKWLAQNGKSPMKRVASFGELTADDSSEGDYNKQEEVPLDMPNQDNVWKSIQARKETKDLELPIQQNKSNGHEKSIQLNAWSSILAEKANESNDLPPPYVHPAVVKRSSSTLSEKSLEICTESLGSESSSDGISSKKGDKEDEKEDEQQERRQEEEVEEKDTQVHSFHELQVAKYNYDPNKKASPRSFPPVLPSLEKRDGSPALHMHSHRRNGNLVLQAISVPQQDYFQAERQDGRLLLTLVNSPTSQESTKHEQMKDRVEETDTVQEVEKQGTKEMETMIEKSSSLPSRMISVHRSALMMKRLTKLDNKDPTWSNKVIEELPLATPPRVARLIPSPPPPPPPATSFNAYEYFWRNKHSVVLAKGDTLRAYEQQDTVLKRGSNKVINHSVPLPNGCKETRRSLLIWHPYCAENYSIRTMI